jgi:hypothetical protein
MSIGSEMAMDAMIDAMVEEDLAKAAERAELFETLRRGIRGCETVTDLKTALMMITNLIEDRT